MEIIGLSGYPAKGVDGWIWVELVFILSILLPLLSNLSYYGTFPISYVQGTTASMPSQE
jgi:hypothetical protein